MPVYVDSARNPFGRYVMCHMWADTLGELLAMVDRIGVQRKWLQQPPKASWVHFDITQSKRALAVAEGAIQTDKYGPLEHVAKLDVASGERDRVAYGTAKLEQIARCRKQYTSAAIGNDTFSEAG